MDSRLHPYLFGHDDQTDDLHQEGAELFSFIRIYLILFIAFIAIYFLSYGLISYYSKRRDEFLHNPEEGLIYWISRIFNAFTLAISIATFLLLPVSITINEISSIENKTKWTLLDTSWKFVFISSNLSLLIVSPLAYFLLESQGFSGSRGNLTSRLTEALSITFASLIMVVAVFYVVSCGILGISCPGRASLWTTIPFLYSCISFLGALLLLMCTPLGISHLITVINQTGRRGKSRTFFLCLLGLLAFCSIVLVFINTLKLTLGFRSLPSSTAIKLVYEDLSLESLMEKEEELMLRNTNRGLISALTDIVMILYLSCASLSGLYNLPGLCCLQPRPHNNSFNQIFVNCYILCILSSALPLLARILGMTDFDLLANFGSIEWLGNFYVALLYNLIFLISTGLCLSGRRELVFTINAFRAIIGNRHQRRPSGDESLVVGAEDNKETDIHDLNSTETIQDYSQTTSTKESIKAKQKTQ